MKHSYVVFDKLPEVNGMPNIRDHDESLYFRIQGETLSVGGYEINPALLDKVNNAEEKQGSFLHTLTLDL
jgi:sarcosine dehydrogenase